MKYLILISAALIFLTSCNWQRNKKGALEDDLPYTIDFDAMKKQPIGYDEMIESIQFVPLEFNSDCAILYIVKLISYKDTLFAFSNDEIYLFSQEGKFLKQLAPVGRGPGEYTSAFDFTIDPTSGQLYIYDSGLNKIHVYLTDGTYIKSIDGSNLFLYGFASATQNQLLLYPMNFLGNEPNKLVLINDERDTLETYKNYLTYDVDLSSIFIIPYDDSFYTYDENLYYRQFFSDTLYRFDSANSELIPHYLFKGVNTMPLSFLGNIDKYDSEGDNYSYLHTIWETDKYLFIQYDEKEEYKRAIYSKESKAIICSKYVQR